MGSDPQVKIDLSPYIEKGVTKWTVSIVDDGHGSKGGSGQFGNYPTLNIGPGQMNSVVTFTIVKGNGWKFAPDAIWITDQGSSDPTGPMPVPATIQGIHTFPGGTDSGLRFVDTNAPKTGQTLHYTLNFVNGSQKSSTLDPIIQNGGCCPGGGGFAQNTITISTTSFIAELAIAFFVGALIALIVQRFRSR